MISLLLCDWFLDVFFGEDEAFEKKTSQNWVDSTAKKYPLHLKSNLIATCDSHPYILPPSFSLHTRQRTHKWPEWSRVISFVSLGSTIRSYLLCPLRGESDEFDGSWQVIVQSVCAFCCKQVLNNKESLGVVISVSLNFRSLLISFPNSHHS